MENISKFDHEKIKRLLKAYPEEVTNAYLESREILEKKLPEEILYQWENIGVDISKESARSWESALAYFNVSVKVQQYLPSGQFLGWSKAGYKLSIERANVVKNLLIDLGIKEENIKILGKGEIDLNIKTNDEVPHPANRRAEISPIN